MATKQYAKIELTPKLADWLFIGNSASNGYINYLQQTKSLNVPEKYRWDNEKETKKNHKFTDQWN